MVYLGPARPLTRSQAHAYRERKRLAEVARALAARPPAAPPAKRTTPAVQFPPTLVTGTEYQRRKAEYGWWRDVRAQRDPATILATPFVTRKERRKFLPRELNELGGRLWNLGYTSSRDRWTEQTMRLWFDFDRLLYVAIVPLKGERPRRVHAATVEGLTKAIQFTRPPRMSRAQSVAVVEQARRDRLAALAARRAERDRDDAMNRKTMHRAGLGAQIPALNDRAIRRLATFRRAFAQEMYRQLMTLARAA